LPPIVVVPRLYSPPPRIKPYHTPDFGFGWDNKGFSFYFGR
jgi:hypothetical protein